MSKLLTLNKPIFLFLLFFYSCQDKPPVSVDISSKSLPQNPQFELLTPTQTNINFQNTLTEGLNTNVLLYEYFYNGGGVAAGDFNGDELIDLYFTSNMTENKLYLNKGNLQFEEVTKIAKAGGRPGPWKTGVTHADVNGDGKLDIYICYSGALPDAKRQNQLFINQGNNAENIPIFEEKAAQYGLNSPAFSNQGYFFDYDRDGDLDMLLLNHSPQSLPVLNEVQTAKIIKIPDPLRGLRLFKQTNGKFKDVTEQAGISGSGLSYGLGIGISDVNDDGWADFYVSNDYTIPDYLYLNNKNGTFTDKLGESMGHTSHFSMGNDVADINNDGLSDILSLDMLPEDNHRQKLLVAPDNYAKFDLNIRSGFHHQYMRNMLHANNGNGTFSEIGQLMGIDKTDWSWSALLADYDNDGWKDLYVTNGYHRDYTNLDFIKYMEDFTKSKGRLKRTDVMELINSMPSSDVVNYAFKNEGGTRFSKVTRNWGMQQIANSNGAAYADLDNDGDLEIIVNNVNKPAFIYENKSNEKGGNYLQIDLKGSKQNPQGIGAKITINTDDQTQTKEQFTARGYLSSITPIIHFGLGNQLKIDELKITWQSGYQEILTNIAVNQKLTLSEANAKKQTKRKKLDVSIFKRIKSPVAYKSPKSFIRDFNRQPLLISELSHEGPDLKKGDLNGDGLLDIFIGGTDGAIARIFLGNTSGGFESSPTFETLARRDAKSHSTDAAIFDANGDGHQDIYVANGGYHDYPANHPILSDILYLNDGKGNFSRSALPKMLQGTETVETMDINGDGHLDIFVAGATIPGKYPETSPNHFLINNGKGQFTDAITTIAPDLQHFGKITAMVAVDINKDEQEDLVIVGAWLPISIFINQNGKLVNETTKYLDGNYQGWWNTIAVADLNKDGQPDFVVGNQGANNAFQVSPKEPAELVYKDFDKNSSIDPFFNYYKEGKNYPDVMRDELLGQLAHLRSKYTSFDSYADATMETIFSPKELADAQKKSINHLSTSLFLSNATGKYDLKALPIQAQYAPINAIQILDVDKDGQADMLLCGNNSHQKLRMGKSDANYGVLLKGNGQGNFEYINQTESGLVIKGDVQSVLLLENRLLFGINEHAVVTYELN
ncbi:MAG: VCBS repeat-containing protein [Saprospiraceae bacterium]